MKTKPFNIFPVLKWTKIKIESSYWQGYGKTSTILGLQTGTIFYFYFYFFFEMVSCSVAHTGVQQTWLTATSTIWVAVS